MAERPNKLQLEIVTPRELLFAGEVDWVSVPGIEGYLGILPGHAPLLSELKIGVISYRFEGKEHRIFCSWGFVEVLADRVSILAESAERPEQIDRNRAQADKEKAENLLRSRSADTDFKQALELWEASVARLEVVG
ncbi:MAG TPA: F0F1 ATP synthase subunit epsilon [Acidobacteriota bacterium]|nr:F0F1 ATP synthase subunit epsilon [Acidobacteriota bacterium]